MGDDLDVIIKNKYTNALRKGYAFHDGIFMLTNFPNYRKEIENFEVRDDDVWVSSFAKAGTTWTQEMVWLIANNLDYEGAQTILPQRFPFLEVNCVLDFVEYKKDNPESNIDPAFMDAIKQLNDQKSKRFIKTHLPWKFLPLQLQNQTSKAKIIHVMRNPKDVCISYHHHTRSIEGSSGTLDDFFKLFMAGKVVYGPYWDNVLSFWEKQHLPNLLLITYEDMKKDLPAVIRKVAKFLNKEVPEDQMDQLVDHLSFEQMKNNKAVNFEPLVELLKECVGDTYESDGIFMRSGIVGSHKTQMTEEMIKTMDDWIEENTSKTGLKFNLL